MKLYTFVIVDKFNVVMNCNTDISLVSFIGRTMHSIMRIMEEGFAEKGIKLNLPQFILLNVLSIKDDFILEDLAKLLYKDKSAILRYVNQLENEHFIAKMKDKNDGRRKILVLTRKGMEILAAARKIEENVQEILTKNLGNNEINSFKNVLEQMNKQSIIILEK